MSDKAWIPASAGIVPFLKMNGAGNDFVVFDARKHPVVFSSEQIRKFADRNHPITQGCDQVIVMEHADVAEKADVFMRIYNADGGEVAACGNATRCIGWLVWEEKKSGEELVRVQTKAGILTCRLMSDLAKAWPDVDAAMVADLGHPRFVWDEIPLSKPCRDTLKPEVEIEGLPDVACVGMGNPHVVFMTDDLARLDMIETIGPELQRHPLFDVHGVNVTIAHAGKDEIRARVWERGVGITAACGTAACATGVIAVKRGYRERNEEIAVVQVTPQSANLLYVRWNSSHFGDPANNHVMLAGPVQAEFVGEVEL